MNTITVRLHPGQLRINRFNARTHSKGQLRLLRQSVESFGFTAPVIVDENLVILAGEGRYRVALEMGLTEIPVVKVTGLSEARKRAYLLADNKIASRAGWDRAITIYGWSTTACS